MKINKIDHIGAAVKSIEDATNFYQNILGLELEGIEEVTEQKVKVCKFVAGESTVELLEPTDPSSPIAKFLEKKGTGIHHICLEVDDIEKALEEMKEQGARLIDEKPRIGAGGKKIAFVHPKTTGGILIELTQS
jgi:methylmalonyl-CoA/ethylmalonyl-CoA epimerase